MNASHLSFDTHCLIKWRKICLTMNYRFADNQVLFALRQDRAAGAPPSPAGVSKAGVSRGRNLTKEDGQNCLLIEFRINNSCMRSRTGFNLKEAVVWFIVRRCWERLFPFTRCFSLSCLLLSVSSTYWPRRSLLACTLEEIKSKAMKQEQKESEQKKETKS